MGKEQQIIRQPEQEDTEFIGKYRARLRNLALLSAPLFLAVLVACNSSTPDTATPTALGNFNVDKNNVLDMNDACKTADYSLRACYDIKPDGVLNGLDIQRERQLIGTTPVRYNDLTGDGKSTCEDLSKVKDFVTRHNGETVETEFYGVSINDLEKGIFIDLISFSIGPKTSDADIQHLLTNSTKYNLLEIDDQGSKNYTVARQVSHSEKDITVYVRVPDSTIDDQSFNIVQLKNVLSKVEGVTAVNYVYADITLGLTQGTPLI